MSEWQPLGKHRAQVRGDLVVVETFGDLNPVETQQLMEFMTQVAQTQGRTLALFDVSGGASMPAESRRIIAQWERNGSPPAPTAIVGANLVIRTLALLITHAINLVSHQKVPLAFFKSRDEAYRWLDKQRLADPGNPATSSSGWPRAPMQ
jgi:hypothetical protein